MKMKKMMAAFTAFGISMTAFSGMAFSASAADEPIAQAYFIGALGAESNWNADTFATPTDITGDGTYELQWDLTAGGTATVEFLAAVLAPVGTAENFTTDTYTNLAVSLDEVWIDGAQVADYTVSDAAINTAYYEGTAAGVTRIYLHDDWAGTGVADLPSETTITQSVKIVFTVSGTGTTSEGGEGEEGGEEGEGTDTEYVNGTYGDAYFIGQLGGDQNWGLDDFAAPAAINGDGTYELQWDLTAGGTNAVQFLAVAISPASGIDNFTTDSFPNLSVTLDEVWVDGVQMTDYVVSDAAIDTAYYEGDTGVTRIYLRDEWAGTGVEDLAGDTTVASSVKVVFTISGLETAVVAANLGDVNLDGAVDASDASEILIAAAAAGSGGETGWTAEQTAAADVNGDGAFDATDAAFVLQYAAAAGTGYEGTLEDYMAAMTGELTD